MWRFRTRFTNIISAGIPSSSTGKSREYLSRPGILSLSSPLFSVVSQEMIVGSLLPTASSIASGREIVSSVKYVRKVETIIIVQLQECNFFVLARRWRSFLGPPAVFRLRRSTRTAFACLARESHVYELARYTNYGRSPPVLE